MLRTASIHVAAVMTVGCLPSPRQGAGDGGSSGSPSTEVSTSSSSTDESTAATTLTPDSSTSGNSACGNGLLDPGEVCDGAPVLRIPCPKTCTFPRGTEFWGWTESSPSSDRALRAAVSDSGDIFIAGNSVTENFGPLLVSLGSNGAKRWSLDITEVEEGFLFAAVHTVDDQVFVQGAGAYAHEDGASEIALLRAAYGTDGSLAWHSYRLTGQKSYEQLTGPIIDVDKNLFFFSIEERFGNGHSPGVLSSFSPQGDPIDEVFLEAPRINRFVRVGDWTTPMMIASSSPGELYVGGAAFRSQGSDHAMLQRRTTDGALLTSTLYQNPDSRPARYSNAVEMPNGQVVTVGSRRTPTSVIPMIHLYSTEGERLWGLEPDVEVEGSQNAHASVAMLDEQTVVVVGSRERADSGVDGWLGCVSIGSGELEWETTIKLAPDSLWTYPQDIEELEERVFVIVGSGSDGKSPDDAFARAIVL